MTNAKLIFVVFIFIFTSVSSFSQVSLSTSQTLPSLKRLSITTEHFRVIYPKNLSSKAKYVASSLEASFKPLQKSLRVNGHFERIDIILQNQSAVSNGYVALSPFRSEWETLPALTNDLGSTNWLLTLSVHEQRHIHQFLQYKTGFAKWMKILFGDFGTEVSIALSLPRWFFEGDAVVEETLLTNSGRGRVADFSKTIRSMIYENDLETYTHVYNRSYKSNRPGPYELGYLLNLSLRSDYMDDTFNLVVSNTVRNSYWPYKLEKNIGVFTGKKMDQFYFDSVKNSFPNIKSGSKYLDDFLVISDSSIHNEVSIEKISFNNNFLYFKSGYEETGGFYEYDPKQKQEKLIFRTNVDQTNIRVRSSMMAFSDIDIHPRYSLVSYSNVYIYDLKKREKKKISFKGQFLKSQLSFDQTKVASLYFDKSMSQSLVILNLLGEELSSIALNDRETIRHIEWKDEDTIILVGIDEMNKQFIRSINLISQKMSELLYLDYGVINDLKVMSDGKIFLSSDVSGVDQIYQLVGKELRQYSDAPVAARYPSIIDDKLFYSSFKRDGFRVKSVDLKKYKNNKAIYGISRLKRKEENITLTKVETKDYSEKEFNKKSFRLHSWSYITNLLNAYNAVGSISTSDNLNELNLTTGFVNNFKEGATSYFTNIAYQKYWPIFFANVLVGKRSVIVVDELEREQYDKVKWDQNSIKAGVTIPYNIIKDAKSYSFDLTSSAVYNKVDNKTYVDEIYDGELLGSSHRFNFNFSTLKPYTRLYPEFLFNLNTEFSESQTKVGKTSNAFLKYIGANIGAPGFSSTSSFILKYDHQEKSVDDFNLVDRAFFARGYDSFTSSWLDTASLNYSTSLFYPDLNIFDFLYLKRIRTNLFYDYTVANKENIFKAYGAEISFDLSPLRFNSFELGFGFRFSYLDKEDLVDTSIFLESLVGSF